MSDMCPTRVPTLLRFRYSVDRRAVDNNNARTMSLVFEWDPRKARSNSEKHRISFAEAVSVFSDPLARIFPDEEHSAEQFREVIIGHSAAKHLLPVCFTEPETDRIRIISARRATRVEQYDYEEHVTN